MLRTLVFSSLLLFSACGPASPTDDNFTTPPQSGTAGSQPPPSDSSSTDVGKTCRYGSECQTGLCALIDGAELGYCTRECADFTDCPDLWTCGSFDNASTTYCKKD